MSKPTLQPSDVLHSTVVHDPLKLNYPSINTLFHLLKTCIGPHSRLKVIQNSTGGHVTVTSTSVRLFSSISVKNLLIRFICSAVKSHLLRFNNGGIYCGLLIVRLLDNSLRSSISHNVVGDLIQHFGVLFVKHLEAEKPQSHSNIKTFELSNLRAVVGSIIDAKPACLLTKEDRNTLSMLLLNAFINMIPNQVTEKVALPARIDIFMQDGASPDKSEVVDGLLMKFPERMDRECLLRNLPTGSLLVVLFTVSLAGDAAFPSKRIVANDVSVWEEVLDYLQTICRKLVSDGVQMVFSQKVIHPALKKQLEESEILCVDRLGFEMAENIKKISGAVPVTSLHETSQMTYGLLTKVSNVSLEGKRFILVQNDNTPYQTVVIRNYNEEALNETKVVCQQVIDTLYRLLKDSRVCSGGGCTEVHIAHLVKEEVLKDLTLLSQEFRCSTAAIHEALDAFLASIYDVALSINQGTRLTFLSETVHHHLWALVEGEFPLSDQTCQCGMYTAHAVSSDQWYFLNRSQLFSNVSGKIPEATPSQNVPKVLDELGMKVHAATVAFETAYSLLQLGLSVLSGH